MPDSDRTIDLGSGMFASGDHNIVNWRGENYYRACGVVVTERPDGSSSSCVKRVDHPGPFHEDWDGDIREVALPKKDYGWHVGQVTLDEAVGQAVGAGSMCWNSTNGVFNDTEAANIVDQLIAYIRELGPIYG